MVDSSYVELVMSRDLTGDVDVTPTPKGFMLRWYRPGDEVIWHTIQTSTGIYDPVSPRLFQREFGSDAEILSARQCYLVDLEATPFGTATAWVPGHGRDPNEGRVHWGAVIPEAQRRGLGTYLTRVVCERLRHLGAGRAYLTTGSANTGAVQLYLGLGFRPEVKGEPDLHVWRSLAVRLDPRFRKMLDGLSV